MSPCHLTMTDKQKNKKEINLKKRGFKTSPLSNILPSLVKKIGGAVETKNTASLVRVLNHWTDIMGTDMAPKSMPVKIYSKRQKDRHTGEQVQFSCLRIKTEGSLSTAIAMRETIIVERLNRLFGADHFKKIDIEHGFIGARKPTVKKKETTNFDIDVSDISDPVLKSRLESLGQAVMNSAQNKERS
jgi:hypothetical protein